jgi:small subunit ribosomal protein S17
MNKAITKKSKGRILTGRVVSSRNLCTIVEVTRFVKQPKYGKYLKVTKRYKAHDQAALRQIGGTVSIIECRPISRDKHFKVIQN